MVKPEEEEERVTLLESPEPDLFVQLRPEQSEPLLSLENLDRVGSRFNQNYSASSRPNRNYAASSRADRSYAASGRADRNYTPGGSSTGGNTRMSSDENNSPESSLQVP